MKVKELVDVLSKLDGEMIVCVDGYEGGIEDLRVVLVKEAIMNANSEWWYGSHELLRNDEKPPSGAVIQKVVYLPR